MKYVALAIGGCFALLVVFGAAHSALYPDPIGDRYRAAEAACQEFVTARLRAPSTAVFGGSRETNVQRRYPNLYLVSGWVEARNAAGVPLRNQYGCEMEYNGREETWRLVDVVVE